MQKLTQKFMVTKHGLVGDPLTMLKICDQSRLVQPLEVLFRICSQLPCQDVYNIDCSLFTRSKQFFTPSLQILLQEVLTDTCNWYNTLVAIKFERTPFEMLQCSGSRQICWAIVETLKTVPTYKKTKTKNMNFLNK